METAPEPTLVPTDLGYSLGLDGSTVYVVNAKGKRLKSVPAKAKKTDEYLRITQLGEFLARHDAEAGAQVQSWVLGAFPVQAAVLAAVWPDEAWRSWLVDVVVADAAAPTTPLGFLREVEAPEPAEAHQDSEPLDSVRIGVVDLDGETVHADVTAVVFPHPLHLGEDLAEYAEFSAELGLTPRFDQLFRQVHVKPDPAPAGHAVTDFAGAHFELVRHAISRARSLGFEADTMSARCTTVAEGRVVEARLGLGEGYPDVETWLGDLEFLENGRFLDLADVPAIAWSEGMRMATLIHAARAVEETEEES
ncbi:DUF4132 domain-containing protein [Brevibacterium litoralis]|uniref:DUF4132 domain-containing protein n=1 Tax=Brevibacterium litoralis TaxID=3138935 RepID=UPI0032EFEB64